MTENDSRTTKVKRKRARTRSQKKSNGIETFHDAFVHELSDMQNAEKQLVKALPKMAKAAFNPELTKAFETHLKETEQQVQLIDKAAKSCGMKLKNEKCDAMEGLINEGKEIIKDVKEGAVRDSMLIAAAQKVEHYEIAGYGCLVAAATQLGFSEAVKFLDQILDQEKRTDEKLNQLAEQGINQDASQQNYNSQKGKETMASRNGNGGQYRERDEEGRFMSDDDRSGSRSRGRSNMRSRGSSRYEEDDDGRGHGRGGWFGDSEGHSEASRRGWQNSDHGDSGWFGDSEGHSEASRRGWQNSDHGDSGWFGDSEGHSEAARRGWEEREGGRSRSGSRSRSSERYQEDDRDEGRGRRNYSSSRSDRYSSDRDYDDRRYSRASNDSDYDDDNRSRRQSSGGGQGRGWFGDSEGHARAGRQSHDYDRGRSSAGRR